MTPADLQNQLIKRIKELFTNFPLSTLENEEGTFNVYKQNVPERMESELDYSNGDNDKSLYPFVVVKIMTGEKVGNFEPQKIGVQFIIGVQNEGLESDGYEDVMAAMQLMLNDFDKKPHVDHKVLLEYPINWVIHDENTYPYYFAGIESKWEAQTLNREDIGGFLHGN